MKPKRRPNNKGTSNGGYRPSLISGFLSRRGWPTRFAESDEAEQFGVGNCHIDLPDRSLSVVVVSQGHGISLHSSGGSSNARG